MADETTPSDDPTDALDPTAPDEGAGADATETEKAEDVEGLKAELERLRKENARMRKGLHPVEPPPPTAPAVPGTPGDGPVLWEGTLDGDTTAPKVKFRGSASEAEAREAYLEHAGITATDKKVKVSRVEEPGVETADVEAEADGLETKPKTARGAAKKGKKK